MKLRIMPDGTVRGLWHDAIDWPAVGHVAVRRASHIEFCPRRQQWYVQSGQPRRWWRRLLQWVFHRPCGEVLHWAATRGAALDWEREHFEPGGSFWPGRDNNHTQQKSR